MLNNKEQSLIRGWIANLPYKRLADLYNDDQDVLAVRHEVAQLRAKLERKARLSRRLELGEVWRCDRPVHQGFTPAWQQTARRVLDILLALPEPTLQLDDPVSLWLPERFAKSFEQAGLDTFRAIHDAIAADGASWWKSADGVGPAAARCVMDLFRTQGFGPVQQPLQRAAQESELRVFLSELYLSNVSLDGSSGSNRERRRRCQITARHDYDAIQAWLELKADNRSTARNYRREAERFLLWCLLKKRKPLSSIDVNDCNEYSQFVRSPDSDWLGPYKTARWSSAWKPFRQKMSVDETASGGLSIASQQLVRTVLNSLFQWLVSVAYLESNPFQALPRLKGGGKRRVTRTITVEQWQLLLAYARSRAQGDAFADTVKYRRIEFILVFAYTTGLRLHELAKAMLGDIEPDRSSSGEEQFWLSVVGKGSKHRDVPLPASFIDMLNGQLNDRGYPLFGICSNDIPIIGRLKAKADRDGSRHGKEENLTVSGLHQIFTDFFAEAARHFAATDRQLSEHIGKVTAHWLRHSHASRSIANGLPLHILRDNLGHADISTTSIYIRSERDERHRQTTAIQDLIGRDA